MAENKIMTILETERAELTERWRKVRMRSFLIFLALVNKRFASWVE